MKKVFVFLTFALIMFSCVETGVIDGPKPFVVTKIEQCDNGSVFSNKSDQMSKYYSNSENGYEGFSFEKKARIILPSGMYNIGDTITMKDFKLEK